MNRLSTSFSLVMRIAPVFFIVIPLLIAYRNPKYLYFCVCFIAFAFYIFFFTKQKILLQLNDVYMDNRSILLERPFSTKPSIKLPFENAIKVDYLTLGNQIIGKFWFYDPQTSIKSFVYFWPTKAEAKWESSKLYQACIAAGYERDKTKDA